MLLLSYGALGVLLGTNYGNLRKEATRLKEIERKQRQIYRRGMRRVKTFVATGYNDGTGNPAQAVATIAKVQGQCDGWTIDNRGRIDIVDIQVVVDSKNHSGFVWHGACVSTMIVHYYEIVASADDDSE
jgi:hypothetical protein